MEVRTVNINFTDAGEDISTYHEAIRFAGNILIKQGLIEPQYIDACIDREVDFPTGLLLESGLGVAMPHGNSNFVNDDSISVVRTLRPITFGRMEDKSLTVDCHLIFNLALASGENHLTILRKLIRLFQDTEFIEACRTLPADKAADLVKKKLS